MNKNIRIEYRASRTKEEKALFGLTVAEDNEATIFLNVRKNRKSRELIDTFFHEMAHVFFAFHSNGKQMNNVTEERLARQIGRVCAGVLQ